MPKDYIQGFADGLEDDPTKLVLERPASIEYIKGEKAGKLLRAALRDSSEDWIQGEVAGLRGMHNIDYESDDFIQGFIEGTKMRAKLLCA